MSLAGRRVLVTGGGSGIGAATARALADRGAHVVVVGRRQAALDAVCAHAPERLFGVVADLSDAHARDGLLDAARARLGGLDALVYAAGVVYHQAPHDLDDTSVREQLEVDLVAPLRLGASALDVLAPGGAVVFVGSTLAHRPVATSAVYSAAKAGLTAAARALALTGATRRITVNIVSPGVVDTAMIRERAPAAGAPTARTTDETLAALTALHPLGRLGTPDDVAAAILHLLDAPWVTGTDLVVDGGLLLRE